MQVNGYEVEVKSDGVQVGCTFIPIEKIKELVEKVENRKSTRELFKEHRDACSSNNNCNDFVLIADMILWARKNSEKYLFAIRAVGEFEGQGFVLPDTWEVVKDDSGINVIVPKV